MQRLKLIFDLRRMISLFIIFPLPLFAQIYYDFENRDLSDWSSPNEQGWDSSSYQPLSGTRSLKHVWDNPVAASDIIGLSIDSLKPASGLSRWSFMLRHAYSPSSANNWSVFLASDCPPDQLNDLMSHNGIAISVNINSSDDLIRLVKLQEGETTTTTRSQS